MDGNISFEDWEAEQMQDPEFQAESEAHELAYQITRLRIKQGLTPRQLADLAGVRRSSIARLESEGIAWWRLSVLRRVMEALGARLEVHIVLPDDLDTNITAGK